MGDKAGDSPRGGGGENQQQGMRSGEFVDNRDMESVSEEVVVDNGDEATPLPSMNLQTSSSGRGGGGKATKVPSRKQLLGSIKTRHISAFQIVKGDPSGGVMQANTHQPNTTLEGFLGEMLYGRRRKRGKTNWIVQFL